MGALAYGNSIAAAEFQFDRDWVGKISISISVANGPGIIGRVAVPSLLSSVLDDADDSFALQSLVYSDGGKDFDRSKSLVTAVFINPTDFPGEAVSKTIHESISLSRVEWLDAPSYENFDTAPLSFLAGDTWRANPEVTSVIDPIVLRLIGQYEATLDGNSVIEPFDVRIDLDPGDLPQFQFSIGDNYSETLFFGAQRSFGQGNSADLLFQFGGLSRGVRLTGQFIQVPEPGTIALTLIASGACGIFYRRTGRRSAMAA